MSRAFTKEIDDAPAALPPERPISAAPNLVTARGAELIEAKLVELDAAIKRATDQADIDDLARDQRYWSARHATMQIVPKPQAPSAVGFGVTATIRRRGKPMIVSIVGEDEADPTANRIAWTAPLARALDEAELGEKVEFEGGGKIDVIEVLQID